MILAKYFYSTGWINAAFLCLIITPVIFLLFENHLNSKKIFSKHNCTSLRFAAIKIFLKWWEALKYFSISLLSLQANNVNVVCMPSHKVCFIYLQGILMTNATTTSNEPPKYNKHSLSGCCTFWKMMCTGSNLHRVESKSIFHSYSQKDSKQSYFIGLDVDCLYSEIVFKNDLKTNLLSLMNYRVSYNFVPHHCKTTKMC